MTVEIEKQKKVVVQPDSGSAGDGKNPKAKKKKKWSAPTVREILTSKTAGGDAGSAPEATTSTSGAFYTS